MAPSRFTLALLGALSWACLDGSARGAEAPSSAATAFSIRAGSLDSALEALARQSRTQIIYDPALVAQLRSGGLQGQLAPARALARLLRGSGLRAEAVNANTFLLRRRPRSAPLRRAAAPERRAAATELAAVHVTGSHIPRSDLDVVTPSPLTLIGREQIETSGHQTLFELLRLQPGMIGHHPVDVAADGGQGVQQPFAAAATTSLNALGPRATLFLIDGRRVANYGLISADLGGLLDLDGIPLSIVERVEILRGGASAIYGADAMAGVVNIILKKHQDGGEIIGRLGRSSRGDADEQRLSFSHGAQTPRGGSVLVAADYFRREALFGAQRAWRTMDHRRHGLGDWRIPLGYRGVDGRLAQPACAPGAGAGALVEGCLLDIPRFLTLQPASERLSLYGHLEQPVGGSVSWSADVRASEASQQLRGAPFHGRVSVPSGHPDAVPGAPVLDYAFFDVGPVRNRSDTRTLDASTGLNGLLGGWEWSATASHHRNSVTSRIDGLVRDTAFTQAVHAHAYRFNVAAGAQANPASVLAAISPRVTARGTTVLNQLSFGINGRGFSLPAGATRLAAGAEFGRDALRHRPDPLMLEHDLALSPQKISIDTHRYSSALFAEINLPLLARVQADVALRLDRRQGYGSKRSPKLGVKWNVVDSLTFRGTAATGYRAPSLFELRRPNVFERLAFVLENEAVAPCAISIPIDVGISYCLVTLGAHENPDLRPETSRSHTLGMMWAPSRRFSLSLDHFRIQRRNEILPGSALDDLAAFPQSLQRDEAGRLIGIDQYFENVGRSDVRGWELDAQYALDTVRYGRYSLRLSGHHLQRLERRARPNAPVLDQAGHRAPDRSALASLQWDYADWRTTLNLRSLGPSQVAAAGQPCPAANLAAGRCRTPGSTTFDVDLQYAGVADWRFGLNVRDIGDRHPLNFDVAKGGYDIAHDDPRGRFFLLSAAYRF